MPSDWEAAQEFERSWWGDCANTYAEEVKQLTYAYKMGLAAEALGGRWPVYDLGGRSVLDIGGGPVSMLLKCVNAGKRSTVADPCWYPDWVEHRYAWSGIRYWRLRGEELHGARFKMFDEVWIYNVLQHVEDPEQIIMNARSAAPIVRLFEWIDIPAHEGHPQMLTAVELDQWLQDRGTVERLSENGCVGRAYYGVFNTPITKVDQ